MENYKYRLEELVSGIEQSIDNLKEVIYKQELLCTKLVGDDEFKEFVTELKKSVDKETQQIDTLVEHRRLLNKCIEKLEDENIIEFLYNLSAALGLFNTHNYD